MIVPTETPLMKNSTDVAAALMTTFNVCHVSSGTAELVVVFVLLVFFPVQMRQFAEVDSSYSNHAPLGGSTDVEDMNPARMMNRSPDVERSGMYTAASNVISPPPAIMAAVVE